MLEHQVERARLDKIALQQRLELVLNAGAGGTPANPAIAKVQQVHGTLKRRLQLDWGRYSLHVFAL